jgi:hypothetical protein
MNKNEIEVKGAQHCTGTCEACECATTVQRHKEMVTFEASFHANSANSFAVLAIKGVSEGSWNTKLWFPKLLCKYERIPLVRGNEVWVTAPKWILEASNVLEKVTLKK